MGGKGFTLVELVIVISILGILAGVAIPAYMGLQNEARSSQSQSSLGAIRSAIGIYYAKNKGAFPSLIELPSLFTGSVLPVPIIGSDADKNINTVAVYSAPGPVANVGGWMYDENLGKIIINSNAVDSTTGKTWSSY